MGLLLDLQASPSAPFSGLCSQSLKGTIAVTPTFKLTPVHYSAAPTDSTNGEVAGLIGLVANVNPAQGKLTIQPAQDNNVSQAGNWQITFNGNTLYQGVSGSSQLQAGTLVDFDGALQADGSVAASRIEVLDDNPSQLNAVVGPLFVQYTNQTWIEGLAGQWWGANVYRPTDDYDLTHATYRISGALPNLNAMPFTPVFDPNTVVDGQNVLVTEHVQSLNGSTTLPGATVTLMPQTVNGTVRAVSTDGGFSIYTVDLANYDLFPNLAVQPGQSTRLTLPGSITVYADANTRFPDGNSIGAGQVYRFTGLIFDDGGALRMDCSQVRSGVAE